MKAYIISNGQIDDYSYYRNTVGKEDFVICADGAIYHCINMGIVPDLWIGDFDSCDYEEICAKHPELKSVKIQRLNPVKDETDTHIACLIAKEKGYDNLVIWGALGNRADHMLSNIHLLELLHANGISATVENEKNTISYFDSKIKIHSARKYLSLIPLDKSVTVVKTKGLLYNLENYNITREISLGVSNEVVGESAEIVIKNGAMLAIESED